MKETQHLVYTKTIKQQQQRKTSRILFFITKKMKKKKNMNFQISLFIHLFSPVYPIFLFLFKSTVQFEDKF